MQANKVESFRELCWWLFKWWSLMKKYMKAWLDMDKQTRESVLYLLFSGCLLVCIVMFLHHCKQQSLRIKDSINVGVTISAEYKLSDNRIDATIVSSTGGTFLVDGVFQVIKGNQLTIEVRGDDTQKLCDIVRKSCFNLKGNI